MNDSGKARNVVDWIDGFMKLTENSEPPKMFLKWSAISTIAAALQRKVKVCWGTSLTFYPNMYIVLVGPSASRKGTAMNFALDIIKNSSGNIRMSSQATSLQALIRKLKENNMTDMDTENGDHIFHSSMTIVSKEFTVFLGYNNRELISALCDWYDCDDKWSYDTISRDKEEIIGVWVNLLGGTTPDSLKSALSIDAIGGGLTSRIIFVAEETKGKLVVLPTQTSSEAELQKMLIDDLEQISLISGQYRYTENFLSAWIDWAYEDDTNPPFVDKYFEGYNGRRRTHLIKLCMIVAASKRNDLVITKDDLDRAIEMLKEVEVKMTNVFKGVGRSDISDLIYEFTKYLDNSGKSEVPIIELLRVFNGTIDKFTFDRVMSSLEMYGQYKFIRRPTGDVIVRR